MALGPLVLTVAMSCMRKRRGAGGGGRVGIRKRGEGVALVALLL
jgi:hypothetical protein